MQRSALYYAIMIARSGTPWLIAETETRLDLRISLLASSLLMAMVLVLVVITVISGRVNRQYRLAPGSFNQPVRTHSHADGWWW
jgi:hypothetical protein